MHLDGRVPASRLQSGKVGNNIRSVGNLNVYTAFGQSSPVADSLPLYPEIPERLKEAARMGRLVPFIGAGVSQLRIRPSCGSAVPGIGSTANIVMHVRRLHHVTYSLISYEIRTADFRAISAIRNELWGTPEPMRSAMSRYTVRSETSSRSASAAAVTVRRRCRRPTSRNSRSARLIGRPRGYMAACAATCLDW
jgi:hypothetical protein